MSSGEQNTEKRVLAIDFGASSGRAVLGLYRGDSIEMQEIHRFSNDPVMVNGTLYWDVLRLFFEIKQSLMKAKQFGRIDSIGIDTWGVDFGLLDQNGVLLENPIHYRDSRTAGMVEKSFEMLDRDEFYQITGNQFMEINTAFQLLSLAKKRPHLLDRAKSLLLMPDLFNYFLTGKKAAECSIASTTQLFDAKKRRWSDGVIESLKLPRGLFEGIVPSGTVIGSLSEAISSELGIVSPKVIAVAGHDTQSALAAVPANMEDFLFLSCGTWSLLGTELSNPIVDEKSKAFNITNEAAYGGKVSFLKNIVGLWLVQESRRQLIREGKEYSFAELEALAQKAEPLQCFIDPDDALFNAEGDMPHRIQEYCIKTGQKAPEDEGELIRCINESLALKYRFAMEQICSCTEKKYQVLHMLGGGVQSSMLCQMTANACQLEVLAGPVEATVLGNIAVQLIAAGEMESLEKARTMIGRTQSIKSYKPMAAVLWNQAYERFKKVIAQGMECL